MRKTDYREQIELLLEELNFFAQDPVSRLSKGLRGEFKYEYKELDNEQGTKSLYFMFYYQDTKYTPVTIFALRRNYEIPKEQWDKFTGNPEAIINGYLDSCYKMVLRWALLGKTVSRTEGNNVIRSFSFRDLIEGNYELSDNN